jgi:hypothetical protein
VKFCENDPLVPQMHKFYNPETNEFYRLKDVKYYEYLCLKMLNYKFDYNTALNFIEFFLFNGLFFKNTSNFKIESIHEFIYELLDNFIDDEQYAIFSSLDIAVACISCVLDGIGIDKVFLDIYRIKINSECINFLKR